MIKNPWYYEKNIIRNIDRWVRDKDGEIWLDLDGVCIHSCQAICDMVNEKQETDFTGDEVLSWNFKEICPNLSDENVEDLFADPIFFQYVKWIDGAKEFIALYKERIILISKGTEKNIKNKEIFLEQHNIEVPFVGLTLKQSKSIMDMSKDIFIDDSVQNLKESDAKYKILFKEYHDNKEREWQKDWNGLVMYKWR